MSDPLINRPRRFSLQRWFHFINNRQFSPVAESFCVCGRVRLEENLLVLDSLYGSIRFIWTDKSVKKWSAPVSTGVYIALNFHSADYNRKTHVVEKTESYEILGGPSLPIESAVLSTQHIANWSQFIGAFRQILKDLGLLEVTTPTLVINPGMEPELEPFKTIWKSNSNSQGYTAYLCTSPELHLKQLLARDITDIFEIKTVFRNEEKTDYHEPEFQMLEWYRAYATLDDIINDIEEILNRLYQLPVLYNTAHGAELNRQEKTTLNKTAIKKTTVRELIKIYTGFDLKPDTSKEEITEWLVKVGETPDKNSSWGDLFHHFWISQVELKLPHGLLIVRDYPPPLAALSKINSQGWADRFEFYWDGIEIANAFQELTDEKEQRIRFENDQKLRVKYGRTPLEIDENFMQALKNGLPPTAGIALGLDRLFMRLFNIKKIQDTRPFSITWDFKPHC
jgi:lysyl-tRNA synthetase class 2